MHQFLNHVLMQQDCSKAQGLTQRFSWRYLAEGVLECIPHSHYDCSILISAGVHGNETAPIEIVDQIVGDLFSGQLILKQRVLFILGHPKAIRAGTRFVEYDLNRLFCGAWQQHSQSLESSRAKQLEMITANFFSDPNCTSKKYHYDLHTAIKPSLLPTFALIPFSKYAQDQDLVDHLCAAELDAVVYHSSAGNTFSNFSAQLSVASVTLELGKANPFGANDLADFSAINHVLRAMLSKQAQPIRQKKPILQFKVLESIIKHDESFEFHIDPTQDNFNIALKSQIIARDQQKTYQYLNHDVYLLFLNPKVKTGLRAGLILQLF